MSNNLSEDQAATVSVLLKAGKTIKEISKFANLDRSSVTSIARDLNIEPSTATQLRAKELYSSPDAMTYQDIAEALRSGGFTAENGKQVHYLTVSTWASNYGWSWGGSPNGEYLPPRSTSTAGRAKYSLRLSQQASDEINSSSAIKKAADLAWEELGSDRTQVVQIAVIRGAAAAGVTNVHEVRKQVLRSYGDLIRNTRA